MDETERDHEAVTQWQERAQDHRSSVNSQFLTYAGALLGLEEVQLLAKEGALKWAAAFELAGFFAGLSFVLGTVVVLAGLHDARLAARVAKLHYQRRPEPEIDAVRQSSDRLGEWTDRLIRGQVVTFFLAIAAMIAWIVTTGWQKL